MILANVNSPQYNNRMSKHNGPHPKHPSERFWSKVRKLGPDECWEWVGARHPEGYGYLYAGPLYENRVRWVKSHRLSWEIHNGQIPDGLSVLHHCDNPPCVNPSHLYVGTQAQNVHDRTVRNRGRNQDGSVNSNAKLTEADVVAIIAMLKTGRSQAAVAEMFGVKQPQISRIARRESWRHLWDE